MNVTDRRVTQSPSKFYLLLAITFHKLFTTWIFASYHSNIALVCLCSEVCQKTFICVSKTKKTYSLLFCKQRQWTRERNEESSSYWWRALVFSLMVLDEQFVVVVEKRWAEYQELTAVVIVVTSRSIPLLDSPLCWGRALINNWNVDSAQWSGSNQAVCVCVCVSDYYRSWGCSLKRYSLYIHHGHGGHKHTEVAGLLFGDGQLWRECRQRLRVKGWNVTVVFHHPANDPSVSLMLKNVGLAPSDP